MLLPRAFAMRNMRQGTPSWGATTARRLKSTRAVGRENLANMRPVTIASPSKPTNASTATRTFASTVRGTSFP
jgi:hypothetical protein